MDPVAQAYFRRIEERFIDKRGQALLLSPGDVARVSDWYQQGVPLEAVLEAIDVHFERMARRGRVARRAVTLAFLEDDVLDAWSGAKRRKLGRPTVAPKGAEGGASSALATRDEHARACAALRTAGERLVSGDELSRSLGELVLASLAKLESKAELFDESSESHDDERAEDHLRRLEKSLLTRVREVLGAAEIGRLEVAAAELLGDKRHRMDEKARERATTQLVDRSLRERLGIPRLSLFYA